MSIEKFIEKYGPWDAHSIEYTPGKFTIGSKATSEWIKKRAEVFACLVDFFVDKPFNECRILDVGCFEGGITYHIGKFGAEVIGLEIRDALLGRCSFLNECFPDLKIQFVKGDMLKLEELDLGEFDAILLAGTLYHVDAPAIIPMLKTLQKMTPILIIDTHIADRICERYDDLPTNTILYGRSMLEHNEPDDSDTKSKRLRSSHQNNFSFWPTEISLTNALSASGFTSTFKALAPTLEVNSQDRQIWVACVHNLLVPELRDLRRSEPDKRPAVHAIFQNANQQNACNPNTKPI
ncbi:MAG: class I SAM-dependent methyltransferase [Saprospiraceae bacterium]|nr:class I SAM-dependent methyltransferase [Saprospiraceae bacterium]